MLSASDTKIETVLPFFIQKGIDVTLLVPTTTGMAKSIMDATIPVRKFLSRNDIHNYDSQQQGRHDKVCFPAFFVGVNRLIETEASLYRPLTKSGDPRIWFKGLKNYCNPRNLLGIATDGKALFIFNLSDPLIISSILHNESVARVLDNLSAINNVIANELLLKLRAIHSMGFVDSTICGDTGIGMTLEKLLQIAPNSSTAPDYKGIELKATRINVKTQNRVNLFSQIPDWNRSNIKTAQELLDTYGYMRNERLQLYCTVSSIKPNSQGLFFEVDENKDRLFNKSKRVASDSIQDVVLWELESLRKQLAKKHRETFWVKGASQINNGVESFRYDSVVHTRKPNTHIFGELLDRGIITMDYTLSQCGTRVRDHGYLFKIKPENIGLLFPDPIFYTL